MATAIRTKALPLNNELLKHGGKFSFETAAYILGHYSKVHFGHEISIVDAPFKTLSLYEFHIKGNEIEKITQDNNTKVIHISRLPLAGLNAPLPTPYSELIMRRSLEQDQALGAFVNMFNTRILGISYRISSKRYIALQNHNNGNCPLVCSIANFIGASDPGNSPRKFSRLAYLFWTKERSAVGLETLITYCTQLETHVVELQPQWMPFKESQPLGKTHLKKNSYLGTKVSTVNYSIKIQLSHKNYDYLMQFVFNEQLQSELKHLIVRYLGKCYTYQIDLRPKNLPPLTIGSAKLGQNSWLPGKTADPLRIFCK